MPAIGASLMSLATSSRRLEAELTGTCTENVLALIQTTGYSAPLMVMVRASTGASPVMVIRLLLEVIRLVPVILNTGASSLTTVVRMLVRALAIQVLMLAGAVGLTPLA